MTEEQKQEAVSREFVKILAYTHGFKVTTPELDHGVDITIIPVTKRTEPSGKTRFIDSPYRLDFQLKSTTQANIHNSSNGIKYDLEAKTYNDLVARRQDILPMHLVVIVFDMALPDCVNINSAQLALLGRAYWFLPDINDTSTENISQIRISIPKENLLGAKFVQDCYDRLEISL